MELTNAANEFVGSPIFGVLVLAVVIIAGLVLRLTFQGSNSEYKHNPDN